MTSPCTKAFIWMLIAFGIQRHLYGVALSDEPDRNAIIESVKKTRSLIEAGFRVKYHVEQKAIEPAIEGAWAHVGVVRPESGVLPLWRAEHARKDGKWYAYVTTSEDDSGRSARIFDGTRGYVSRPTANSITTFDRRAVEQDSTLLNPQEEMYREVIGFESLRQNIGPTIRGFKSPHPYDLLAVLEDEHYELSWSTIDGNGGRRLALLQWQDFDRIWLDPERSYSIVQRERCWNVGEPLSVSFRNVDFGPSGDGALFPRKTEVHYYGRPDKAPNRVIVEATLLVDEISFAVPDALFEVVAKPGQVVIDQGAGFATVLPKGKGVPLDKFMEAPDEFVPKSQLSHASTEAAPTSPRHTFAYVVAGIWIVVVAVLFYGWWRSR